MLDKGLPVGKIVKLPAGLHHNPVSFIYIPSTFRHLVLTVTKLRGVQYSQAMNGNSFVHLFKHLFIEHLIHARHSSSCLRYTINETDQNLCCFGERPNNNNNNKALVLLLLPDCLVLMEVFLIYDIFS